MSPSPRGLKTFCERIRSDALHARGIAHFWAQSDSTDRFARIAVARGVAGPAFLPGAHRLPSSAQPRRQSRPRSPLVPSLLPRRTVVSPPAAMERVRWLPGALCPLLRRWDVRALADHLEWKVSSDTSPVGAVVLRIFMSTVQDNVALLEASFVDHSSLFEECIRDVRAIASETSAAVGACPATPSAAGGNVRANGVRDAKRACLE